MGHQESLLGHFYCPSIYTTSLLVNRIKRRQYKWFKSQSSLINHSFLKQEAHTALFCFELAKWLFFCRLSSRLTPFLDIPFIFPHSLFHLIPWNAVSIGGLAVCTGSLRQWPRIDLTEATGPLAAPWQNPVPGHCNGHCPGRNPGNLLDNLRGLLGLEQWGWGWGSWSDSGPRPHKARG